MTLADLLRALLPPTAYDPQGETVGAVITGEANALQAAIDSAQAISDAMDPQVADNAALAEWERTLAITPRPDASLAMRAQAVLAKLAALGGLSIPYFTRLAAGMGYGVAITEPRAFRCGISHCGERLYGEDVVFVWQVTITSRPAGADATTDAALQAVFDDLKPAHTLCQFLEA